MLPQLIRRIIKGKRSASLGILLVFLLASLSPPVSALLYPVKMVELNNNQIYDFTKGGMAMYSYEDAPFWIGGSSEPYIRLTGSLNYSSTLETSGTSFIRLVVYRKESYKDIDQVNDILHCKSDSISSGPNDDLRLVKTQEFDERFEVTMTGHYLVLSVNCMDTHVELNAVAEIHYSYGYLPIYWFGVLRFQIFVCCLYVLLAAAYAWKTSYNSEFVLLLQYAIIAVIVLGLIKTIAWLVTYIDMNVTGERFCCPAELGMVISIAVGLISRNGSMLLLLAVSRGFGVVRSKLSRRTMIYVAAPVLFDTIIGLIREAKILNDVEDHGRITKFDILGIIMFANSVWIGVLLISGLKSTIEELQNSTQTSDKAEKLRMYQDMKRALKAYLYLIASGPFFALAISWLSEWHLWTVHAYYSLVKFYILAHFCYIWRPSASTAKYAFIHQVEEEFESAIELGDALSSSVSRT